MRGDRACIVDFKAVLLTVVICAMFSISGNTTCSMNQGQAQIEGDSRESESAPNEWSKLLDIGSHEGPLFATLTMFEGQVVWYLDSIDRVSKEQIYRGAESEVVVKSESREMLRMIRSGCDQPLRYVTAPDRGFGPGGANQPLGRLVVDLGRENKVTLSITSLGFTLGKGAADSSNTFFSYGLACAVDDMFMKGSGHHLPASLLDSLSGAAVLARQRKSIDRIRATADPAMPVKAK